MRSLPEHFKTSRMHLIGLSGAEMSGVALFLMREGYVDLVGHDICEEEDLRQSFWRFHDWMSEEEKEEAFEALRNGVLQWRFGEEYLEGIGKQETSTSPIQHSRSGEIIFVPQSWFRYAENEPLKTYFEKDLHVKEEYRDRVWSITKLYLELFPGTIIGVTGSNGKSTTTAMIAAMIQQSLLRRSFGGQAGIKDRGPGKNKKLKFKDFNPKYQMSTIEYRLFWGGNDRKNSQPLDAIGDATEEDILLLEMSNRQLSLGLGKSPNVAVITNIAPNHLDDHGSFEAYVKTKEAIVKYQTGGDTAVLNWSNEASRAMKNITVGNVVFFDLNAQGKPVPEGFAGSRREGDDLVVYAEGKREQMANVQDIAVPGEHNVENALAAITAVQSLGIGAEEVRQALRNFRGLDHRLEFVAEQDGVKYVNDSSGCSPTNIVMAVRALAGEREEKTKEVNPVKLVPDLDRGSKMNNAPFLILIAGGYRKNPIPGEFLPVAEVGQGNHVKHIFLIGSVQEVFEQELLAGGVNKEKITRCANLEEAFANAKNIARPGDTIVLTPGCESFGEFRDYRERGERFRTLVAGAATETTKKHGQNSARHVSFILAIYLMTLSFSDVFDSATAMAHSYMLSGSISTSLSRESRKA